MTITWKCHHITNQIMDHHQWDQTMDQDRTLDQGQWGQIMVHHHQWDRILDLDRWDQDRWDQDQWDQDQWDQTLDHRHQLDKTLDQGQWDQAPNRVLHLKLDSKNHYDKHESRIKNAIFFLDGSLF